jgi:hypothetical protein
MIRKLTVYIILVSMVLHSACRLGILDQIYQKRNEIAYAIGLVKEIPIAVCSSDYAYRKSLKVATQDDPHSVPSAIFKAEAINLFFMASYELTDPKKTALYDIISGYHTDLYNLTSVRSVFHPPSFPA